MAVLEVFQKHLVDSSQNVVEFQLHGCEAAHVGPGKCHDQCGAEAMAFGVGYGNHQRTIGHGDEIEIIASGFVGVIRGPANIEAWHGRRGCIEALLHGARQLQLKLLLLLFS